MKLATHTFDYGWLKEDLWRSKEWHQLQRQGELDNSVNLGNHLLDVAQWQPSHSHYYSTLHTSLWWYSEKLMLKHHTAHTAVTIKRGQGRTGVEASYHTNCPNDRERTLTGKNLHWGITSHTAVMIQWITCIEVSHHTHCCDNTVKQGRTSIEVSYHMHCCDITVKTGKNSQSGIISHTLLYWGIISHTHTTVKAQWRQWRTHTEASYDTHWSTEASCHTHTALLWQYAEDREELTLTLYCTWHSQMIRQTWPKKHHHNDMNETSTTQHTTSTSPGHLTATVSHAWEEWQGNWPSAH